MNLRQLSVNLPLAASSALDAEVIIEVFHDWIRGQNSGDALFDDQLLIDVADYRHVSEGPGILLIAHQGFYSLSERGLRFSNRRDDAGPAKEKIANAVSRLLTVAERLAVEPRLDVDFDRATLEVQVGDRLLAPSREALAEVTSQALAELLARPVASEPEWRDPRGLAACVVSL